MILRFFCYEFNIYCGHGLIHTVDPIGQPPAHKIMYGWINYHARSSLAQHATSQPNMQYLLHQPTYAMQLSYIRGGSSERCNCILPKTGV